jgi:hypothetical protein
MSKRAMSEALVLEQIIQVARTGRFGEFNEPGDGFFGSVLIEHLCPD